MRVKRCSKCKVNYASLNRHPCLVCGTPLIDHDETDIEIQVRLVKKDKKSSIKMSSFTFLFQISVWFFLLPSIGFWIFNLQKYVINGTMLWQDFILSWDVYTYKEVLFFYANLPEYVSRLF